MKRMSMLLLVVLLVGFLPRAEGTTVIRVSLPEMVKASAFIFHGTVVKVESKNLAKKGLQIVTDVTFRIHRVYKGKSPGEFFTLRLIGGTWNGYTLLIPGQPKFKVGEEVLLFLEWTGKNYAICGMSQGKFSIFTDSNGKKFAYRDLSGLGIVERGRPGIVEGHKEKPIPFDKLVEQIVKYSK